MPHSAFITNIGDKTLKFLVGFFYFGGFTEWLYRVRQDTRKEQMKRNFSRTIV